MKACVIQPAYSTDFSKSEEYFEKQLELLTKVDKSVDIIVLPESADCPCLAKNEDERKIAFEKFNKQILNASKKAAKRCNAIVFVNARDTVGDKVRNTTFAINRKGEIVGKYYKQHLTPGEVAAPDIDSDYTYKYNTPTVIEIEGLRFGFLTCYDFYFYEYFSTLARLNLDFIIGCSHQRSDSHDALEIITRFLAYNTNTYVLRSSVSMDENSNIGGGSMIVAPNGEVLVNAKSQVGIFTAEINPENKFYKPAGFGNPNEAHWQYIEKGRRPWLYRQAGGATIPNDKVKPFPRVCAHRGFNTVSPENTMPAYGAAVAMDADEIEFDLWPTSDGEIVSCHDPNLDRVSNGTGNVFDLTYEELLKYDFGCKFTERFEGLKIVKFEEILQKFGGRTILNIHIKPFFDRPYPRDIMEKIIGLIREYDCEKYVYLMIEIDADIKQFKEYAPDIAVCIGHDFTRNWAIVDRAIELGVERLQFYKPYYNQEMVDKAHAHGIICNVCWSNTREETEQFIKMGMDVILTDEFKRVQNWVKEFTK